MSATPRPATLAELFPDVPLAAALGGRAVLGLTPDSRQAGPGFVFAAIPGTARDGRDFIPDVLAKGAVGILSVPGTRLPEGAKAALIAVDNPRLALAQAAARLFPRQPEIIAAVTGTSGKTSVATFTRQIWAHLGKRAASIGTIGAIGSKGERLDQGAALTTPDSVSLHRFLDRLAGEGIECVAFEASSHGLDQYRLDGVRLKAAAFTNLSRDHLDYHPTEEDYFQAKMRLFTQLLPAGGIAVINTDTPHGERAAELAAAAGRKVWRVGQSGWEIRFNHIDLHASGQNLDVEILGQRYQFSLPLAGVFQAWNAALAAGLVLACGGDAAKTVDALTLMEGTPGRLEFVGQVRGASVYVDYAHKPDALKTVLEAIRPHTAGRLHVVVGCGGDRDKGKRPIMGRIAAELADRVIVTDDNPRSEEAATIRREVMAGIPKGAVASEIGDRRAAIAAAVAELDTGDTLIIAGKGHESGQIIGDKVIPFDDRDVAREILRGAA